MSIVRYEGNGRMSKAVRHGDTLYLAGQTARDAGDVTAQTAAVLEKVDGLLNAYGSDRQHMLSAVIYLRDIADFAAMNAVWDAWVEKGFEPARACVEAKMAAPEILVEVSVVAGIRP